MAIIFQPFTGKPSAGLPQLDNRRTSLTSKVFAWERVGSVVAGAGLIVFGISRRSLWGGLAGLTGAALVIRGATGCRVAYQRRGVDSRSGDLQAERRERGHEGIRVTQAITVQRDPVEVFRHWRKLENLAQFMQHVESVEEIDSKRSHWVVRGPLGQTLQWDAQIVHESEGQVIGWESLPGAEVNN